MTFFFIKNIMSIGRSISMTMVNIPYFSFIGGLCSAHQAFMSLYTGMFDINTPMSGNRIQEIMSGFCCHLTMMLSAPTQQISSIRLNNL